MGRMNRKLRTIIGALALSISFTIGFPEARTGSTSSWTPAVRERMIVDALKVAPPTLARIILRHPDALLAGLSEAGMEGESPQHRQDAEGAPTGATESLDMTSRWAAAAIDGHKPLREFVFRLGVVAHYASDLRDPLLTSTRGATAGFGRDFSVFVERNVALYPVVFYGYAPLPEAESTGWPGLPPLPSASSLETDGREAAGVARGYFLHLERAYAASGGSSEKFDVRSIPFGVASICYSRAVTGIARAWLHVWRSARGDLSGTPHLPGAPPSRAGAPRTRAPKPADPAPAVEPPSGRTAAEPREREPVELEGNGAMTKTIYGKSKRERARKEDDASED
jgi:hypothetical protein